MRRKPILLLASSLLLLQCTEELNITPYDYTKIFTGEVRKGWSIRNIQFVQPGAGTVTFGLPDCVEDDIYIFYANPERTFQIVEGDSRCSPTDPYIFLEDTWSFVNATATFTAIVPVLAPFPLPYIVREVSEQLMTFEIFNEDGSSYRINFRETEIE